MPCATLTTSLKVIYPVRSLPTSVQTHFGPYYTSFGPKNLIRSGKDQILHSPLSHIDILPSPTNSLTTLHMACIALYCKWAGTEVDVERPWPRLIHPPSFTKIGPQHVKQSCWQTDRQTNHHENITSSTVIIKYASKTYSQIVK